MDVLFWIQLRTLFCLGSQGLATEGLSSVPEVWLEPGSCTAFVMLPWIILFFCPSTNLCHPCFMLFLKLSVNACFSDDWPQGAGGE